MKTGRFIQTIDHHLDRNVEYLTEHVDTLLQDKNFKELWDLARVEGAGIFTRKYPQDMAIARSVIGYDYDNSGRAIFTNDTIIIKFDFQDSANILDILEKTMNLTKRMETAQKVDVLKVNPLPEITI